MHRSWLDIVKGDIDKASRLEEDFISWTVNKKVLVGPFHIYRRLFRREAYFVDLRTFVHMRVPLLWGYSTILAITAALIFEALTAFRVLDISTHTFWLVLSLPILILLLVQADIEWTRSKELKVLLDKQTLPLSEKVVFTFDELQREYLDIVGASVKFGVPLSWVEYEEFG